MFEGTPPACSRLLLYMPAVCVCTCAHAKPAAASASVPFLSVVPCVFFRRQNRRSGRGVSL